VGSASVVPLWATVPKAHAGVAVFLKLFAIEDATMRPREPGPFSSWPAAMAAYSGTRNRFDLDFPGWIGKASDDHRPDLSGLPVPKLSISTVVDDTRAG